MPLTPFFSLSASTPQVNTYDPANPSDSYANAVQNTFGGFTGYYSPYPLGDQSTNDEILVGYDAVDPTDQTINSVANDVFRHCSVRLHFSGYNVSTENQYLVLFALRAVYGSPTAQFFVGTSLVNTEALAGEEQVALLLDCPGNGVSTSMYVRLASTSYSAIMGFQGVDCYLL